MEDDPLPIVLQQMALGYLTSEELYIYSLAYPTCPILVSGRTTAHESEYDTTPQDALKYAAATGWIHGMEALGERGVICRWDAEDALAEAAEGGHMAALEWLWLAATPPMPPTRAIGAWHDAVLRAAAGGHVAVIEWLATKQSSIPHSLWNCALMRAAQRGQVSTMEWLVCERKDPQLSWDWERAFLLAAEGGHVGAMEWCSCKATATADPTGKLWSRALCDAASGGHIPAMEWLVRQRSQRSHSGSDSDSNNRIARDKQSNPWNDAFCYAAGDGQVEAMKWIVAQASKEAKALGRTVNTTEGAISQRAWDDALLWAAENEDSAAVEWLMTNGGAFSNERLVNAIRKQAEPR